MNTLHMGGTLPYIPRKSLLKTLDFMGKYTLTAKNVNEGEVSERE